ncbi:MAG: hypothetical protein ACYTFY_13025 [Planctomycetota bacterium]|jgi:hypothetical protein
MKNIVLIPFFVLFVAFKSFAGPVDLKQLPGETSWMIHLDVEKLLNSKGGEFLSSLLMNEKVQARLQIIEESTSVNLTKSIQSITLSGIDEHSSNAVLQIKGSFDKDRLRAVLQFITGYKESFYNSHLLVQWQMRIPVGPLNKNIRNLKDIKKMKINTKPGTSYACFYKDEMIIIGQSEKTIARAVDVLEGKAANLADVETPGVLKLFKQDDILSGFAVKINKLKESYPRSAILRQIYSVHVSMLESNDDIISSADIKIDNQESVEQIMDIMKGARALALLSAKENPKLAALARKILINSKGKVIKMSYKASMTKILERLKKKLNLTMVGEKEDIEPF